MNEKDIVLPPDSIPVVEEVAPVVDAPIVTETSASVAIIKEHTFDNLYCATCRMRLTDAQLMKTALDYEINADGSSTTVPERYSFFCGTCQKFLGIYDPKAQHELAEMIRLRQEHEKTQK
jgi:hypothetical protein